MGERLRAAYLGASTDLAPAGELIETLGLACRVGDIARALTWDRAIRSGATDEWERAPFSTLTALLADSYVGEP